jgi:hypothetical protein
MGLLDNVSSGRVDKPAKLLVWGPPAVGKSSFASQAPDALFIEAEDRTGHLDVNRIGVKTWEEVFQVIKEVATGENIPYKTLVFDTVDAMEILLFDYLAREAGVDSHEDIGGGWFKFRTPMIRQWKRFTNQIDKLTHKGFQCILLAHAQTKSYQPPGDGAKYDRFIIKMDQAGGDFLVENVDLVGHAKFQVYVKPGKDKSSKATATTLGKRVLSFKFDPVHPTKQGIPIADSCDLSWKAYTEALK